MNCPCCGAKPKRSPPAIALVIGPHSYSLNSASEVLRDGKALDVAAARPRDMAAWAQIRAALLTAEASTL